MEVSLKYINQVIMYNPLNPVSLSIDLLKVLVTRG